MYVMSGPEDEMMWINDYYIIVAHLCYCCGVTESPNPRFNDSVDYCNRQFVHIP